MIYLGRENRLVRELTRARAALSADDKAAITRVQAWFSDTVCLDTDEATDPISYTGGVVTMQPGLASTLGIQLFIVVGGVTGLIPLTGLTTPWMSYGGSSLVANYVLLAILVLLSHAARRPLRTSQHTPIAAARTEVFGRS
jgi:Flp pilus assembly protein TadB